MGKLRKLVFGERKLGTWVGEFPGMEPRLESKVLVQQMLDGNVERKRNDGMWDDEGQVVATLEIHKQAPSACDKMEPQVWGALELLDN